MTKILGFDGSLRKESYNRALLRAAQKLAPAGAEIEIFDIGGFPLYNEDIEKSLRLSLPHLRKKSYRLMRFSW